MPVIPTQTSRVQAQPYNATRVNVDDSIGQGLQQVGAAIGSASSNLQQVFDRKEKQRASLEAATGYQTLAEQLHQDLIVANDEAPADGTGLYENYATKSIGPKTEQFLSSISDPELRQEYELRLRPLRAKAENDAVNAEFDKGNKYSLGKIGELQQEKSVGIATDPTNFESWVSDLEESIDDAPNLTPTQREELKRKWRQSAPVILAETLKGQDPETLYFATGHGTGDQRRSYVSKAVVAAVAQAETAGRTDLDGLKSPKGALGRMQIMPDTAVEIAQELGDRHFLSLDAEGRERYLLSESVSYRYGEHYLNKMLKQNGNNLTLALIAYNAGQKRADEFVEKGGDWSKMGKWANETQPYVDKIIGMIGSKRFATNIGVPRSRPEQQLGTGARLPIKFEDAPGRQPVDADASSLDRDVVDKWELVQGALGRQLPVVSGYRSPEINAAAGGAENSQHLHGDAIDIDVRGLTKQERIKVIELASAAGFTGIGVYNTSLHFDIRDARKAWGPSHSADSVPGWAQATIGKHIAQAWGAGAGTTVTSGAGGPGRPGEVKVASADGEAAFMFDGFRDLSPATLVATRNDGLAGVKTKTEAEKAAKELAKAQANDLAAQDIASMRQSGKSAIPPDQIDDFQEKLMISDGPAAVLQWARDRARAQRVYTMTEGIAQLSSSQLEQLLDQKPSGGPSAADDQAVYEEVVKVVDEEKKRRHDDPGEAVQDHPLVKPLAQAVDWKKPDTVEDYLAAVFTAQDALGMDRAPLPKEKAQKLGRDIGQLIRMNPETDPADITKGVLADLYNKFGFAADEVFMQAIETIMDRDISKETKSIVSSTMLDWIKQTPGLNDPNYRRLKERYNWNYVPELAAQDKVPLTDDAVFQPMLPTSLGERSGQAVRGFIGGMFSSGMTPAIAPAAAAPGGLSTLRPPGTMRIKGVPDAAFDQLATNPGDPAAQSAFKKQFGGDAFTDAMKLIKQQQDPRQ